MLDNEPEQARIQNELEQVRATMADPRVGLFAMKRLYARLGQLLRELDRLTERDTQT